MRFQKNGFGFYAGVAPPVDSGNANGYRLRMDAERIAKTVRHDTIGGHAAPYAAGKVASRELLGDRGELIIVHAGREYRLRLTQNGKLILTA